MHRFQGTAESNTSFISLILIPQSSADASFWHGLASRKLNEFKLSEEAHAIHGFYHAGVIKSTLLYPHTPYICLSHGMLLRSVSGSKAHQPSRICLGGEAFDRYTLDTCTCTPWTHAHVHVQMGMLGNSAAQPLTRPALVLLTFIASDVAAGVPPRAIPCHGALYNVNTIDAFKKADVNIPVVASRDEVAVCPAKAKSNKS